MDVHDYIKPELLILVPVLYFFGKGLKRGAFPDRWIPLALGIAGVVLSGLYVFSTCECDTVGHVLTALFVAMTQGVLVAGASVYADQLVKQARKEA